MAMTSSLHVVDAGNPATSHGHKTQPARSLSRGSDRLSATAIARIALRAPALCGTPSAPGATHKQARIPARVPAPSAAVIAIDAAHRLRATAA